VIVRDVLRRATGDLERAGVENPRIDAQHLLAHALGVARAELPLHARDELSTSKLAQVERLVARRATREPLAYVLGEWGFRRLTLKLDRRALVPRPETEAVVERCLALLRGLDRPDVLDVGTGSGAIALAIADEHPGARVFGVDLSRDALALARENAARLGLAVELFQSGAEAAAEGWDLVVSNPPYVESLEGLEPELSFEPPEALLTSGLTQEVVRQAQTRWLVLEVADDRAASVAGLLDSLGYEEIRISPDLTGRERIVEGRRA
jgi:release factor glutamine methyltransferase